MKSRDDLRRIAEQLLLLADAEEVVGRPTDDGRRHVGSDKLSVADPDFLLGLAQAFYTIRKARSRHIPADFLGEPNWDILLDLFIAKSRGKMVSITSACIASHVPPTTALRWIALLEEDGLIIREGDKDDRRRFFIRLSEEGEKAMIRCLIEASSVVRPIQAIGSLFKGWQR